MTQKTEETAASGHIRAEAAKHGISLWRNNSGALPGADGRPVRFGLGNDSATLNQVMKSSDLIGITPRGQFIALEVKKPGWQWSGTPRERAQQAFLEHIRRNYGIAGFVRDWAEAAQILRNHGVIE